MYLRTVRGETEESRIVTSNSGCKHKICHLPAESAVTLVWKTQSLSTGPSPDGSCREGGGNSGMA